MTRLPSNVSARYALIAVQGPKALEIVQPLTGIDLASLKYYWFAHGEIASVRGTVSRTGYTGEDGFEIFVPPQQADAVWRALTASGEPYGMIPCGLGARDTLRLEAAMSLHGNDIDETRTPVEAGLNWIVGWKKDSFVGSDVLKQQKADGTARKLVGFEMIDRGIGRQGYAICSGDEIVGVVTSGTQTPYLKKAIGLGYVSVGARRAWHRDSTSTFAAVASRRESCRPPSTRGQSNGVSGRVRVHEGPRVDRAVW